MEECGKVCWGVDEVRGKVCGVWGKVRGDVGCVKKCGSVWGECGEVRWGVGS